MAGLEEILKRLQALPGFEEEVTAERAARALPAAPEAPAPTADPYAYEQVVQEGTRQEREQLVQKSGVFPNEPTDLDNQIAQEFGTLRLPGWDKRLEELGNEVKVEKKAGGFLGVLESVVDIAGNPVGKTFDIVGKVLDTPAEGVERLIGMAYYNEVPLSDRWEMARWTYDSMWADAFGGGGGGKTEAVQDYEAGRSWEEIDAEHTHNLGNTVAHFALDPLWLIGGVPLVGKLPGPVAKAAGTGLNFSKIPGLRSIPGVRRIGQSPLEQQLQDSVNILDDVGQESEKFNTHRVNGGARRLWERSAGAHVDDAYTHVTNVTAALTDPSLWEGGAVREMFTALSTGRLTRQNTMGLEGTTPVKTLRRLFEDNPDLNKTVQSFESLNPMSANAFWSDAKHAMPTVRNGQKTSIPELIASGQKLEPEEWQRYGSYRSMKFMEEFSVKGLPALYDVYKLEKSDLMTKVDALSGAMKTGLSMFTINTPGFVAMNFGSNAASLITKLDDPAGLANYMTHGLSSRRRGTLDEMGFTKDLVSDLADDSSFYKEFAGGADEFLRSDKKGRRLIDKALPFVKFAAKTDQGGRVTAIERGVLDASAAVWKTGAGGVKPELDDTLRSVPGLEDWVDGLKFEGFGAVRERAAAFESMHSDEFITAGGLLTAWAKGATPNRFPEAGSDNIADIARYLEASFPDAALSQLDDVIVSGRTARRAGEADYLHGLDDTVENWKDDIQLDIFDRKLAENFAPDPINYGAVRDRLVPWEDAAEFSRLQKPRQELYTRIIAANHTAFGGEAGAKIAQNAVRLEMSRYEREVRALLKSAPTDLNSRNLNELRANWRALLTGRNDRIQRAFGNNPRLGQTWKDLGGAELKQLDEAMDARAAAVDAVRAHPAGSPAAATAWGQAIEQAHVQEASALEGVWKGLGLEYTPRYAQPEGLSAAMGNESLGMDVLEFLDFAKTELPNRFRNATVLTDAQVTAARELMPKVYEGMTQRNLVAAHHARATRDFTMLNYSQKRGFDSILALAFPYHFWVGRTAKDWMRMTAARPGQTAAFARFFQSIRDINEDANLPERLRGNIRIPIPFLDEKLFGGEASMYFDPLRLVYPLSSFQSLGENAEGKRDSDATTALGRAFEFGASLGVGINPFMTLGLGSIGALGDRDAYLRRGLASVNSLPFGIPGPRVFRSAADWMAGISEDPDPEYLTPEIKQLLANGQPLPENVLKEAFGGIADLATADGWEGYRTDRMVANLVGSDPQRWSARDGLEALRYRRGPLWTEAVRLSKKEKGLRVLTGWGLMPVAAYPEGEEVQSGLDAMFREIRDDDDPQKTSEFFKQHPEYQVRRIAMSDREDPAGQLGELDTALFFLDMDKVDKKFTEPIDLIRENVRRMEEAGYMETKEGRRMREVADNDVAQLTELRQADLNQLDALYPHRNKELSPRAAPHERALHKLREEFYAIRRDQFKSDAEFYAARDAFKERLPIEGADAGEWMQAAVRSIAVWNNASDEAGARPGLAGEIIAKRDQHLRELTDSNVARVSREDFQRYLSQNGKPPTANMLEYQQASNQIGQYMAIGEAPGLTDETVKVYRREFWKSHPLLEKYYGGDEPKAWNADSAFTYGRMDEIWKDYYAVEGDKRAQRDYLATQLPELNDLRRSVGLYPFRLLDFHPLAGGVFSRSPETAEVLK